MIKNLIELTKIRIGFLVLTTTIIGFYLGSEGNFSSSLLLYTIIGTLCSSTGGSIINNVIEVESDKKMDRTKDRVLPTKKISVQFALFLGLLFAVLGIFTLYLKVNTLTAILSALTIILYLFVYTPLKRVSWINTSIGAIPGAIPPLGGWTAATNSLDWGGIALFLILEIGIIDISSYIWNMRSSDVDIELTIARTFQASHLKDAVLNFQNLQKNQKSVERTIFYDPRVFKNFKKYHKYHGFLLLVYHIYILLWSPS